MAKPLKINNEIYWVHRLDPDPKVASSALRLVSPEGEIYDLAKTPHGITCECWPFLKDGRCKHSQACAKLLA